MPRKYGRWFPGDVYAMSSDEMVKIKVFEDDVVKPTALETKIIKGKSHSRFYHKPLEPGEFWD